MRLIRAVGASWESLDSRPAEAAAALGATPVQVFRTVTLPTLRPASGPARSGLGFEYDGGLEPLRDRLTSAGFDVSLTEEAFGSTLHVTNPDVARADAPSAPATLWISQHRPMG